MAELINRKTMTQNPSSLAIIMVCTLFRDKVLSVVH